MTARSRAFVDRHRGALAWRDALDAGAITVHGRAPLARAFPSWNRRPAPA